MDRGVVLIDNGAGTAKFGLKGPGSKSRASPQGQIVNCTAKINKQMHIRVGDEIDEVQDGSLLHYIRPFERGYLNNWGAELDVWSRILKDKLNVNNCKDYSLVLTDAPFTPDPWQNDCNEVVFEQFEFQSYVRRPASWFAAYEYQKQMDEMDASSTSSSNSSSSNSSSGKSGNNKNNASSFNCLVVDSGFSFSHAYPYINGRCVKTACKRINVGGKLLTNYLKELVSYRQWNMMDEFRLINQVKEETCFVSMDILEQMKMNKLNNTRHVVNRFNSRGGGGGSSSSSSSGGGGGRSNNNSNQMQSDEDRSSSGKRKFGQGSAGRSTESMDVGTSDSSSKISNIISKNNIIGSEGKDLSVFGRSSCNNIGEDEESEEEESEEVLLYDTELLNNYGCLKKRFALPDFQNVTRGFVKDDNISDSPDEQLLIMDTERVSVPELLFRPSDIGIKSAGISEASFQALECLSPTDMALAASRVILTGGNVNLHNFSRRFTNELRAYIPDVIPMQVVAPALNSNDDPSLTAIRGMCSWVNSLTDRSMEWTQSVVTRQEYLERGHAYCNEKFASSW